MSRNFTRHTRFASTGPETIIARSRRTKKPANLKNRRVYSDASGYAELKISVSWLTKSDRFFVVSSKISTTRHNLHKSFT